MRKLISKDMPVNEITKRDAPSIATLILCSIAVLTLVQVFVLQVPTTLSAKRVSVVVSIVPQKYFVDQIGKGKVNVIVMVPPGANPHSYEPKPKQMIALSGAKAYLTIGIEFEKAWLQKVLNQNRDMKIFHMEEGIKKIPIRKSVTKQYATKSSIETLSTDTHGDEKLDPHIWLSPILAKTIASNTANALITIDPSNTEFYNHNLKLFLSKIDALHEKIRKILDEKKKKAFIVFHPAWGYFAWTYGLKEVPIELEGKEPSPKELKELIQFARQRGIKVILVEPQFSDRIAKIISREIHGKLIKVDPLAYEWDINLLHVAEIIGEVSK